MDQLIGLILIDPLTVTTVSALAGIVSGICVIFAKIYPLE